MADFPKAPPAAPDGKPDPDAIEFVPYRPMVKWFTPSELTRTGAEALVSSLFGAYADNRELQALRGAVGRFDYSTEPPTADRGAERVPLAPSDDGPRPVDEIWVDYVADLGDGWDPTFSIASLLAAETLTVGGHETRRGRVLVLGGDQVYPTAKREEYQNRFAGPYRAALPYVVDTPPHLFAVPGNHDWYDGLTSFTRLFCQNRWIGGWKTQQRRSYFALKLPGDWWLWGVDVQLSSDIDEPQLHYFQQLGAALAKEHPEGANIILCLAEPVWTSAGVQERMEGYDTLARFEELTMTRNGHRHAVGLAGDLHAYARWEHPDGRQRFISGGGGAYLYPTHRFPEALTLPTRPPGPDRAPETFHLGTSTTPDGTPRKALFPPERTSQRLAARVLAFPFLNKRFSLFFGVYYLVLAWLVQSASLSLSRKNTFLDRLAGFGDDEVVLKGAETGLSVQTGSSTFGDAFVGLFEVLAHAPVAFLAAAVLLGGLIAFADGTSLFWKIALGSLHFVAHIVVVVGLTWGFAVLNLNVIGLEVDLRTDTGVWQALLFATEMIMGGTIAAGVVWAAYLFVAHIFRRHTNEVFSSQSLPDYKHFLRLHVRPDGLTIYPIGVDKVPHAWTYQPGANGTPWFLPTNGPTLAERAHLVDGPIEVQAPVAVAPGPAPRPGRRVSRSIDAPSL